MISKQKMKADFEKKQNIWIKEAHRNLKLFNISI